MIRTLDPAPFNRVCNHADVRPWLGGEGEIDVTALVSNAANYALWGEYGGFIFEAQAGGSFEAHSQFLPEGRGQTVAAMKEAVDYMFTRTNCVQITTFIPDNNRPAQGLGLRGGFKEWFRREHGALGVGAQSRLEIDHWIARTAELEADGAEFHDTLEAAVKAVRPDLPDHPEDATHNRYVGACLKMARNNQCRKGEAIYNRYAANSGYTPTSVISEAPPLFDMSEPSINLSCLVGFDQNWKVQVLLCQ